MREQNGNNKGWTVVLTVGVFLARHECLGDVGGEVCPLGGKAPEDMIAGEAEGSE